MSIINDLWKTSFKSYAGCPDVSIVVPAFGQLEVTAECLTAIARTLQMCETTAEVILIDDASDQNLEEVFRSMRGLKIYRNHENLGFLGSCNRAVKMAIGKDIVLLNNDTIPTGRWLDHLFKFRADHPGALVVGARLVSVDGRLQESGGIIFKNSSGWNFGRGWDWDDPRCSYPREVDYCSGAALLIEGRFARALGPFDERFAPAYYEDTDLCFEARSYGGEVWVEPRAVVIHLEGTSYGKQNTDGSKPHQERNLKVFADKWETELRDQYPNSRKYIWRARTRHSRSRILFIDNEVPQFDNNSGALRTMAILRLMRESGYEVTFAPINGLRSEPYTSCLESFGVEVLGPLSSYGEYLRQIRDTVEQVWVSRVDVAQRARPLFQPFLKDVPIVFDTVDLHHLRMERQEAHTNSFGRSQQVKRLEVEICDLASVVVVVSEQERIHLEKLTDTPIRVISNIHLIEENFRLPPKNHQAVFVGSFRHTPNIDAVVWFVEEVLPLVISEIPNFEFLVVGDHAPSEITRLNSSQIIVKGWVEDLDSLLEQMRLNIAPLRFGAGVKGKISHALSVGLPTVTTTIGSEGMNLTDSKDIEIADTPEQMAAKICNLMLDDNKWSEMSAQGQRTAEREFGAQRAREVLLEVLSRRQ